MNWNSGRAARAVPHRLDVGAGRCSFTNSLPDRRSRLSTLAWIGLVVSDIGRQYGCTLPATDYLKAATAAGFSISITYLYSFLNTVVPLAEGFPTNR
jgi:hypothetical protein